MLEELEAALRVLYAGQPDYGLHEEVEADGADAPVERLRAFDRGSAAPRADDHFDAVGQHRTELVEFFDRDFIVGVGIADDLAGCDGDRFADAEAFAAPRVGAGGLERRIGRRHSAHDFARAVGAVGGHDDLVAQAAAFEIVVRLRRW